MATEVAPNVFVGSLEDAGAFEGLIICVMNRLPEEHGNREVIWIPIVYVPGLSADCEYLELSETTRSTIRALPHNLQVISQIVSCQGGRRVLMHCRQGRERAPLAMAWHLVHAWDMTWDQAYAYLQHLRPEVVDRRHWLRRA